MTDETIRREKSGRVSFDVEARLLQELGERLVASPEVALLELVKNSSDADAPQCRVSLTTQRGRTALIIADDGRGMSEEDFRLRWMRIATNSKRESFTERYGRPTTGQKGIGRFAIRFLGAAVRLESVHADPHTGEKRLLEALFDWEKLDAEIILQDARVPYRISSVPKNYPTGTIPFK